MIKETAWLWLEGNAVKRVVVQTDRGDGKGGVASPQDAPVLLSDWFKDGWRMYRGGAVPASDVVVLERDDSCRPAPKA